METKIIRPLIVLGVPGVALGVFYLLLRQFDFKFEDIGGTWAAIIAILFLLIVGGIVFFALYWWAPSRTKTSEEEKEGGKSHREDFRCSLQNSVSDSVDSQEHQLTVRYQLQKTNSGYQLEDSIRTHANLDYKSTMLRGGKIGGLFYSLDKYIWNYPTIQLLLENHRNDAVVVARGILVVRKSQISRQPIVHLLPNPGGAPAVLRVVNDGWLPLTSIELTVRVKKTSVEHFVLQRDLLDEYWDVDLGRMLQIESQGQGVVHWHGGQDFTLDEHAVSPSQRFPEACIAVDGELVFSDAEGTQRRLEYEANVFLLPVPLAPLLASAWYGVDLKEQGKDYEVSVLKEPHTIDAHGNDRIDVTIMCRKSSTHEMRLELYEPNGTLLHGCALSASLFVPRSDREERESMNRSMIERQQLALLERNKGNNGPGSIDNE